MTSDLPKATQEILSSVATANFNGDILKKLIAPTPDCLSDSWDHGFSIFREVDSLFRRNGYLVTISAQVTVEAIRPERENVDHIPEG